MLLKQEFDDLKAERHVAGFVGLCAKTESNGGHVAVVCCARHKWYEQKVGQHIFKGETDGEQEFKRTG